MHECPECGMACDCDSEDLWSDLNLDCIHECEEDDGDSWIFDDEVNWYAGFAGTENRPGPAGDRLQHRGEVPYGTLDT